MATSIRMATTHKAPNISKAKAGKCDTVKRDAYANIIHHTVLKVTSGVRG